MRRKQTAIDVGAAFILTVLAWPFPLARATVSPLVHVISILVLWQIAQVGYYALSAAFWRKTPGMHLTGLILQRSDGSPPPRGRAVRWRLLGGVLALPRLISGGPSNDRADAAERFSGLTVASAE
jgi:hypothetical protein